MDPRYIPWPAAKDETIQVSLYEERGIVMPHRHNFIEVVCIAQGTCIHSYNNSEVTLVPGDVFIIVPHEEHSYSNLEDTRIYNCLFYPHALGEDWEKLKNISSVFDMLMVEPFYREETMGQDILHLSPGQMLEIEGMLETMIKEQAGGHTGWNLIQKASLIILLSLLGRAWEDQFAEQKESYGHKREMLIEALKHIEDHMDDELRVDSLASRVYMSPSYFRKTFKEVMGLTPIEYINKARICKAAKLLVEKELTIYQIAEKVGVQDVNYFSRLFRNHMGCSPTAYRKKIDLC